MNIPQPFLVTKLRGKKRHFEFDMGSQGKASLVYADYWCRKAVATINDKTWNFQRKGFWKNEIEITADQSPYAKTNIKCSGWRQKTFVRTGDNDVYELKSVGFWKTSWGWFDATGQKVIDIKSHSLSRKNRGTITLLQPARPELLWLIVVGWFQIIYFEDAAAAIGSAA